MRGGLQGAEDPPVGKEFETPLSTEDNSGVENSSTLVTTLIRRLDECDVVNVSHIIHSDGTVQPRCQVSCIGEVLLTIGLTLLIGVVLWIVIRRILRRFDVLPREDGKAAEMVGRALPEIPVNPRESAAKLPQYECAEVRSVGTQTRLEFPYSGAGTQTESATYVTEERSELTQLYDEIEDLMRSVRQEYSVRQEDIVSNLRTALTQLFSQGGDRPDSGFEEVELRSDMYTPDPGFEERTEKSVIEEGDRGQPVYYNEPERVLTPAVMGADTVSATEAAVAQDEGNEGVDRFENGNADGEVEKKVDVAETSVYMDMDVTGDAGGDEQDESGDGDVTVVGETVGRSASVRVRRTEVERLGGEVLAESLRSREGRKKR